MLGRKMAFLWFASPNTEQSGNLESDDNRALTRSTNFTQKALKTTG
jgi:hypothetical protein